MVAQAGKRLVDVYVGVDVFARSNVVGGRFDTDKVGGGLFTAQGYWSARPWWPLIWGPSVLLSTSEERKNN